MKNKIFIAFFVCSSAYAGLGTGNGNNSNAIPKVNIDSTHLGLEHIESLQEKFFEKRLTSKPEYSVNTYLGNFQTSILINLPKNDFMDDGLWFDYNSSQITNLGYGVGFSLRLSKITNRNNKYFYNSKSNNELVEVQDSLNISTRLNLISRALNKEIIVQKKFRLKDEEDFSLFLKIPEGFLQLKLSGETNVFNDEGLLVTKLSSNYKMLNFSYNDLRLASINSNQEGWSVELNYKENEAQYKYIDGRFYQIPRGLNWILVKQNSTTRHYNFSYQDDLLVSVKKEGALLDLFNGAYQSQKGKVTQNGFDGAQALRKNIVFQNYEKKPEFISQSSDSNVQKILVDLNGDFVTDEVTLSPSESSQAIQDAFKRLMTGVYTLDCDEHRCSVNTDYELRRIALINFENYLNSQKMNLTVRFGKFINQAYQLESDPSLNLIMNISDFGSFKVSDNFSITFNQIRIPRFIDINNDGKKDLILVSNTAEKNFVEKNKDQDLLVLSAFNLINEPGEDNIFNYEGEVPIVYLFKTDEMKLSKLTVDEKTDLYHVSDVSYWEKMNPQFKANSQSMVLDYNRDGIPDILTGKTIYLMGENGETRVETLTNDDLKKMFNVSGVTKELLSKRHYGLIDSEGTGVWQSYVANNYYINPIDRRLHILSDDKDVIFERPSEVPLLTSLKSSFGGSVNVNYAYADGAYVVKEVAHKLNELNQNNWQENFSYEGSKWHIQKNIFLGFKKGKIEKKIFSNKNDELLSSEQKNVEYDLDDQNGPIFYLSRARHAGRVVNEKLIDSEGIQKETANKYVDHLFSNRRSFSFLLGQSIKENGKADLKVINDFPQFLNDIPLKSRQERSSGVNKDIRFTEQLLIEGMYLLRTKNLLAANHLGQKRILESNTWSVDGKLMKKWTPVSSESYSYDQLGRVASYESNNGKKQSYVYLGSSPLITRTSVNDLKTNYTYNNVENDIIQMNVEGDPDYYNFSSTTDGILTKVLKNDQTLFEQKFINKKLVNSVILDTNFKIKLDGLGRVVSKTQVGNGDNLVLFSRSFDDQDRPLQETSPTFENADMPWFITTKKYDVLDNVVNEQQIDDFNNKISETNLTKNICRESMSEIGFKKVLCTQGNGDTQSVTIPNEASFFEYGFSGEVVAIRPFGNTYQRNSNGDVVASSSPQWGKFTRVFDYNQNSITYDDGVIETTTPFGEFKSYYGNGTSIEANYIKRLVQSININLGSRSFTQSYFYNASRVLIGKREFNISWNFQLDQFDRVKIESIKDTKNEYGLQYNRANGVLTDIAPYVTKIEYSPLMKPVLIEYSNGSSAEYEYGPRGELLSYSLTKGMVVYYRAKYQYRSDLKLISENVLTNTQLDEQVYTYNYDNLFELAKKPLRSNNSRNALGQVLNVGELKLAYFHNNLVQLDAGSLSLANFYGANNHYIGSCNGSECFYKISPTEVELNGEIQKLIEVGGVPVGLLYQGNFYPVIIDHKMAVVGLLSVDGSSLKFVRLTDEWGNTKSVLGDRNFEKNIAFSFSKLMQNPLLRKISNTEIYFSETRAYSSAMGEWLTPDSTVIWSPEKLISMPGNWNPLKYANNDPVNVCDVTGRYIGVRIGVSAEASDVLGVGAEKGIAIAFSNEDGLTMDSYTEKQFSVGLQEGAKGDISVKISNVNNTSDFSGRSLGVKVEVAEGVGGGASYSQSYDSNGKRTGLKEVGGNLNAGAEISIAATYSNTNMDHNPVLARWAAHFNKIFGFGE